MRGKHDGGMCPSPTDALVYARLPSQVRALFVVACLGNPGLAVGLVSDRRATPWRPLVHPWRRPPCRAALEAMGDWWCLLDRNPPPYRGRQINAIVVDIRSTADSRYDRHDVDSKADSPPGTGSDCRRRSRSERRSLLPRVHPMVLS